MTTFDSILGHIEPAAAQQRFLNISYTIHVPCLNPWSSETGELDENKQATRRKWKIDVYAENDTHTHTHRGGNAMIKEREKVSVCGQAYRQQSL